MQTRLKGWKELWKGRGTQQKDSPKESISPFYLQAVPSHVRAFSRGLGHRNDNSGVGWLQGKTSWHSLEDGKDLKDGRVSTSGRNKLSIILPKQKLRPTSKCISKRRYSNGFCVDSIYLVKGQFHGDHCTQGRKATKLWGSVTQQNGRVYGVFFWGKQRGHNPQAINCVLKGVHGPPQRVIHHDDKVISRETDRSRAAERQSSPLANKAACLCCVLHTVLIHCINCVPLLMRDRGAIRATSQRVESIPVLERQASSALVIWVVAPKERGHSVNLRTRLYETVLTP
jgi:hypothetical protein